MLQWKSSTVNPNDFEQIFPVGRISHESVMVFYFPQSDKKGWESQVSQWRRGWKKNDGIWKRFELLKGLI